MNTPRRDIWRIAGWANMLEFAWVKGTSLIIEQQAVWDGAPRVVFG